MVGFPAVIALVGQLKNVESERKNKAVCSAFFMIWLLILLLRGLSVGIDIKNYEIIFKENIRYPFNTAMKLVFSGKMELGYYLISKLVGIFTANFRWLLILCTLASVLPIWHLYDGNKTNYPFLSVVTFLNIGLFSIYFSALRQILAMALMVPAYKFAKEKKPFKFILMVACAVLFHRSAIIALLFYPVYNLKLKKKSSLIAIVPLICLAYIFRARIFSILSRIAAEYYNTQMVNTGSISIFIMLFMFVLYCFLVPDDDLIDDDTAGLRNILVLCTAIQIFACLNPIAMRMNYYFLMFVPLLLPRIIDKTLKNEGLAQLSVFVLTLFFMFRYFFTAYTGADILNIYPYIPFWK